MACERDGDDDVQRKADGSHAPPVRAAPPSPGAGRPLDASARAYFEPAFGHSFHDVRVHTGPHADEAARSVHARAYTRRNDIVMAEGQYRPGTRDGDHLLAHELAHVVQQAAGRRGAARRSGAAAEHEADAAADAAIAGRSTPTIHGHAETIQAAGDPVETGDTVEIALAPGLRMAADLGSNKLVATLARGDLVELGDKHPRGGNNVFWATVVNNPSQVGVVRRNWVRKPGSGQSKPPAAKPSTPSTPRRRRPRPAKPSSSAGSGFRENQRVLTTVSPSLHMAADLGSQRRVAKLPPGSRLLLGKQHRYGGGKVFWATVMKSTIEADTNKVGVVRVDWIEPDTAKLVAPKDQYVPSGPSDFYAEMDVNRTDKLRRGPNSAPEAMGDDLIGLDVTAWSAATSPRYVDNEVYAVGVGLTLGGHLLFVNGIAEPILVPNSMIGSSKTATPVRQMPYPKYTEAVAAAKPGAYAYFEFNGRIWPTTFSPASTPRIDRLAAEGWIRLRKEISEEMLYLAWSILGGQVVRAIVGKIMRWSTGGPTSGKPPVVDPGPDTPVKTPPRGQLRPVPAGPRPASPGGGANVHPGTGRPATGPRAFQGNTARDIAPKPGQALPTGRPMNDNAIRPKPRGVPDPVPSPTPPGAPRPKGSPPSSPRAVDPGGSAVAIVTTKQALQAVSPDPKRDTSEEDENRKKCRKGSKPIVWPNPVWKWLGIGDKGSTSGVFDRPTTKYPKRTKPPERDKQLIDAYRRENIHKLLPYKRSNGTFDGQIHHKWPLYLGGKDKKSNLVFLPSVYHKAWHTWVYSQAPIADTYGTEYCIIN